MVNDKLQKIIANAGLTSRRKAEEWIKSGRVSVNGSIAELGDRAGELDKIRVDGKILQIIKQENFHTRVLAYHKPEGEICTRNDPENRPSVFDLLPKIKNSRWINVGRLDINTSGLLFFTNNGELANRLMHPQYQVIRKYAVRVRGEVSQEMLTQLRQGVELSDGYAKFDSLIDAGGQGTNHWYHVTLKEGKNREVRRLWEALNIQVSRLHRIQYGFYQLPRGLKKGRWLDLVPAEIKQFEDLVDLKLSEPKKTVAPVKQKRATFKKLKARKVFRK